MSVCCDITMGNGSNTGEGGKTVLEWSPTSHSVLSTRQYFVSRAAANLLAPTNGLLRASIRVFQLGLSPVFNHALSISRRRCWVAVNSSWMLSSVPVLTFSLSPRLYHCAAASRIPSSTQPRSSEVSLFPEWSEMGLYDSILYKNTVIVTLQGSYHSYATSNIWFHRHKVDNIGIMVPFFCFFIVNNHIVLLPYSGKLSWEKTFTNWWKIRFSLRKLLQIAHCTRQRTPGPQILRRKLSQITTKSQNSLKFSPLKVSR